MNNTKKSLKALFIGEFWHIHMIHSEGHDSFTSSRYEEGTTQLLRCLKNSQVDVICVPAYMVQITFPEDMAQLEQYDAIIVNDIGSNTSLLQNDAFYQLRTEPNASELTKEYVNNGGGLLMIGSYLPLTGAETKANCKDTVLADMLPVAMLSGDDRVEKPEGVIAQSSQPKHPVIKGFSKYPFSLDHNRAIARENAEMVLAINNDLLLVSGNYRNGKIACFMSDCLPRWSIQQFMSWPFYTVLWVNILTRIAR